MARRARIICSLFVLLVSMSIHAKNPPPGTGTSAIPANILIMLDNSGSMASRLSSNAALYYPLDVDVDSTGKIYALEYWNNRIKVFDTSGNFVSTIGGYGTTCNTWRYARQFSIYNDEIYVADYYNGQIKVLGLDGSCIRSRAHSNAHAIAVGRHAASGNSYVLIGSSKMLTAYTSSLTQVAQSNDPRIDFPWGMSLNSNGDKLVVADYFNNNVMEFHFSGNSLAFAQTTLATYSANNGFFRRPTDAAYDGNGNIYVSDLYNHRVQKFNSSLTYRAKVGTYSTTVGFRYPYGLGIDESNDDIYAVDYYNNAVRKYDTKLIPSIVIGGAANTRMGAAKKVIKKIVSNTNLTSGGNFGLQQWSTPDSDTKIRIDISDTGATDIYKDVDNVSATGYTTDLKYALDQVKNYFTSGQVPDWDLACSMNYLIVISDGYWTNHSQVLTLAEEMKNDHNIKTFAVGFALSSSNSNYATLAEKGGTVKPLYAANEAELLQKLTDAIKQAISGKLTFTTPAVMSDITKGNFVYQSTFEYEQHKQWEGHLKKYKLNANGTFGAEQWDAATVLNAKSETARQLWTVGISDTSINNFKVANKDELKSLLFPTTAPTDTEVEDLINFVRGVDTYDEDGDNNITESRHKLADIYHSDLAIVGNPEAPTANDGSSNYQQKDTYYRYINNYETFKTSSNCGGSCKTRTEVVYAGANSGILHAFSTANGDELWGYLPPNILAAVGTIPSSRANATSAIYGVDGTPIVKDIFYDSSWKTVLMAGLGAGGHGYFALDVTDPAAPKHLFAIENDPFDKVVRHWDKDGQKSEYGYLSGSIPDELDYRKLGEAWSTPRIIRITVSGVEKWVAVFGGGYNGAANTDYGSAVFIADLENEGKLLKKIDITDSATSDIVNSIPADLAVITADGTDKATYAGAMVYAADLEGKITKINLTDSGTLYESTTLFNAESNTTNGRYIYKKPEATINNDSKLWLYFGTGNTEKLQNTPNENRLYGIKDKDFPKFVTISSSGTIAECKTSPLCPQNTDLGWYVNLTNSQKVTAESTIDKDRVYFPLYEPTTGSNTCQTGKAILTGYDLKCGNSVLYVDMGTGVLSKVVVQGDNLYIGIAGEAKKSISGFTSKDTLITGKSQAQGGGKIETEGWREHY